MTVHRVIDLVNAILVGAFVVGILPETPVARIAEAAAIVVISYPVLERLFTSTARYVRFAAVTVAGSAVIRLVLGPRADEAPPAVAAVILAAALIGWFLTRKRTAATR